MEYAPTEEARPSEVLSKQTSPCEPAVSNVGGRPRGSEGHLEITSIALQSAPTRAEQQQLKHRRRVGRVRRMIHMAKQRGDCRVLAKAGAAAQKVGMLNEAAELDDFTQRLKQAQQLVAR